MPDNLSIKFITKPFSDELKAIQKRVDRATMWGLREVGRQLKRAAQKQTPVYRGSDSRAQPGRLKRSISSSRRLRKEGPAGYKLTVGPRGDIVHLYARKIESHAKYMHDAYEQIQPAVPAIFERAWARAMRKH